MENASYYFSQIDAQQLPSLDRLVCSDKNRKMLDSLVFEYRNRERLDDMQIPRRSTILIQGQSGTGKDLCASALAHECGLPLRLVHTASIFSEDEDRSIERLHDLFQTVIDERALYLVADLGSSLDLSNLHRTASSLVSVLRANKNYGQSLVVVTSRRGYAKNEAFARIFDMVLTFTKPSTAEIDRLFNIYLPSFPKREITNRIYTTCEDMVHGDVTRALVQARIESERTGKLVSQSQLLNIFVDNLHSIRFSFSAS